jgi:DNA polymerase III delta prime subunit
MEYQSHADTYQLLKKMAEKQAIPQALGFIGPSGIGKFDFAKHFAEDVLLSEGGQSANSFALEPNEKGLINKAQVESVQTPALTAGAQRGATVILVRNADSMNTEAQNALLKLLEDPAPNVFFLLTAVHPSKLLETVRSRLSSYHLQEVESDGQDDSPLAAMYAGRPHLKEYVIEHEDVLTQLLGLKALDVRARLKLLTQLGRRDRKELMRLLELAARAYYRLDEKKALTGALEALGILRYNGNKSLALDSLLDI